MIIYGLKNCDTCRKAAKALGADVQDVRAVPLTAAQIDRFLAAFDAALINTKSTTWRGLSEADRARPPAALLADHPALMKRPVIDADGTLYLGWGADTRAALGVA